MWDSLKEQIAEIGSVRLTGADASKFIKDNAVIFVYEGHKLLIPVSPDSSIEVRHIGNGTVKLSFKCIEVLGKLEAQ